MQKIEITKGYDKYKRGEVVDVSNNVAFGLVDKGVARIFKAPENKMMSADVNIHNKHNRYRIK